MKLEIDKVIEIIDEEIDRLNRLDLNIGAIDLTKVIITPLRNIKRDIRELKTEVRE
ncbi:hypothetical protein KAI04_04225 [Candidatus Pacearchaeota archaeon]|nr:hypothetical protein [Candidatus Pacearchaeota archaeon]